MPLAVGIVLASAVGACSPDRDGSEFSLSESGNITSTGVVEDQVFEFVRLLGPGALPASFSYHGPLAVTPTGRVLTRSHYDCKFAVLDGKTGAALQYFGRCGDGPQETRALAGMGWSGDSTLVVATGFQTLRVYGPNDTVDRRQPLLIPTGTALRALYELQSLNDSVAFISMSRRALVENETTLPPLLGFVNVRNGSVDWVNWDEPEKRRIAANQLTTTWPACAQPTGQVVVLANNGPAEWLGIRRDGREMWAVQAAVPGIELLEKPTQRNTAAFLWNHLPVRVACGGAFAAVRAMAIQPDARTAVAGHMLLLKYDGTVGMNVPFTPRDSGLMQAGWAADDSLFYVAMSRVMNPAIMVLRVRARRAGESGPFLIPDSVRVALDRQTW